jgi:ABC-type Fe3+-siderophore transport system permease subunit
MSYNNKTFSEQIENANDIIALYFVQLILFFTAAICSACLVVLSKRQNVFHANLRILLANIAFGYFLVSIVQIVYTIQILSLFFNEIKGVLQNQSWCQSIKAIYYITLSVTELGLIALVIERTIATKKAKVYERITTPKIGVFLAVAQVRIFL